MKYMNIMTDKEKAKAYDEAIERAKKLYSNGIAEEIFHELKEDDDKKIKNAILNLLKMWGNCQDYVCGVYIEDAVDWLEKQGKQKKQVHFPKFTFDDVLALQCCMETVKKVQEDKELYEQLNLIHSKIYDAYWLGKQGETSPIISNSSNTGENEQKSADKIEPRFKVGDWVIFIKSKSIFQVVKKENYEYTLRHILGGSLCLSFSNEKLIREWTIQDTKDGDVLTDEDNNIGICKKCEDAYWHSYIYLGCDNKLRGFSIGGIHKQTDTNPATKEQRDTLMKTINDAGYEWTEKKELKKK